MSSSSNYFIKLLIARQLTVIWLCPTTQVILSKLSSRGSFESILCRTPHVSLSKFFLRSTFGGMLMPHSLSCSIKIFIGRKLMKAWLYPTAQIILSNSLSGCSFWCMVTSDSLSYSTKVPVEGSLQKAHACSISQALFANFPWEKKMRISKIIFI